MYSYTKQRHPTSVADPKPDPKDLNHFAGSGSEIIVSDPEPDQKGTYFLSVGTMVPVLSKVVKQT